VSLRSLWGRLLQLAWWSGIYLPPDRRVLEKTILSQLASDPSCRRVLSVGVKFYAAHYGRNFKEGAWVTMDSDPAVRRHGAAEHVVDRLENAARRFARESFDAVLVNGVIGWGINTREGVEAALLATEHCLRAGGWLILGLNEKRSQTPSLEGLRAWEHFEPTVFPGFATERLVIATPFEEREHTFLFFRKRSAGASVTDLIQRSTRPERQG
jgi:hypothetical protein